MVFNPRQSHTQTAEAKAPKTNYLRITLFLLLFASVVFFSFLHPQGRNLLTGGVVSGETEYAVIDVHQNILDGQNITLNNIASVVSLRITGTFTDNSSVNVSNGSAKVYAVSNGQKLLVYEFRKDDSSSNLPTGFVVYGEEASEIQENIGADIGAVLQEESAEESSDAVVENAVEDIIAEDIAFEDTAKGAVLEEVVEEVAVAEIVVVETAESNEDISSVSNETINETNTTGEEEIINEVSEIVPEDILENVSNNISYAENNSENISENLSEEINFILDEEYSNTSNASDVSLNTSVNDSIINESINASINALVNESENVSENVSVSESELNNLNNSLNESLDVLVNATINETINIFVNTSVNVSSDISDNLSYNETYNESKEFTSSFVYVENGCLETCSILPFEAEYLLFEVSGGELFVENVSYSSPETGFYFKENISDFNLSIGTYKIINLAEHYSGSDVFFDFSSSEGYSYEFTGSYLKIIALNEGEWIGKVYAVKNDVVAESNEFRIKVANPLSFELIPPLDVALANETENLTEVEEFNLTESEFNITENISENISENQTLLDVLEELTGNLSDGNESFPFIISPELQKIIDSMNALNETNISGSDNIRIIVKYKDVSKPQIISEYLNDVSEQASAVLTGNDEAALLQSKNKLTEDISKLEIEEEKISAEIASAIESETVSESVRAEIPAEALLSEKNENELVLNDLILDANADDSDLENNSDNVSENISYNISENISESISENSSPNSSPNISENISQNISENAELVSAEIPDLTETIETPVLSAISDATVKEKQIELKEKEKELIADEKEDLRLELELLEKDLKKLDFALSIAEKIDSSNAQVKQSIPNANLESVSLNIDSINLLKANSDIEAIYLDQQVSVLLTDVQNITRVGEAKSYATENIGINLTGEGVKVCIIDTGINSSVVNYLYGFDFVNNDTSAEDDHGHGTSVGYVFRNISSSEIVSVKVMNSAGTGYESDIIAGVQYCIDENADIISMSLGGGIYSGYCDNNILAQKINDAVSLGIAVFVSTGNNGYSDSITSPACARGAIRVGASTKQDNLWSGTNYNNITLLLAPGENINTVGLDGSSLSVSGTSISSPIAAGIASLAMSQSVFSPQEIYDLLVHTGYVINVSENISGSIFTRGFARVDALNALLGNITNNLTEGNVSLNETPQNITYGVLGTPVMNSARISAVYGGTRYFPSDVLYGECNSTNSTNRSVVYRYQWYKDGVVNISGTLFKADSMGLGSYFGCAIRANDSRVMCWGRDYEGQIGNNVDTTYYTTPQLTADTSPYTMISVGYNYVCGIRANDSRILCWGRDESGKMGRGVTTDEHVLVPTLTTDTSAYIYVAASELWHTCGIRASDSRVLCWGSSGYYQLGTGSTTTYSNPTLTADTSPYVMVSLGDYHSCGIRANDSRVLCWGKGDSGQMGDGSKVNNTVPSVTSDSAPYAWIDSGGGKTLGIRMNDSRVLGWGRNWDYALGTADTDGMNDRSNPTLVDSNDPFLMVSAGALHSCGIRMNDSNVLCWGDDYGYEIGDGNLDADTDFYNANAGVPYVFVDASDGGSTTLGAATCGIRANDTRIVCWGNGTQGWMGDGSTSANTAPGLVADANATQLFNSPSFISYPPRFATNNTYIRTNTLSPLLVIGQEWILSCQSYDTANSSWVNTSIIIGGARLNITDDTDTTFKVANEQVKFYANYTNDTSKTALGSTVASCNISNNYSGSWFTAIAMTYNSTNGLYEYNTSFLLPGIYYFNISCNNTVGLGNISKMSNFTIEASSVRIISAVLNSTTVYNLSTNNITVYINSSNATTNITDWRKSGTSIAVLNMPFDTNVSNTTTGAVRDYSTYGNNGTLGDGTSGYSPIWKSSGKVGGCYLFDNSDDYILVPNSSSLVMYNKDFTFEAWINMSSYGSVYGIVGGDDGAPSLIVRYDSGTGEGVLEVTSVNHAVGPNSSTLQLPRTGWQHVAMTFDADSSTNNLIFYVNGSNRTVSYAPSNFFAGSAMRVIGARTVDGDWTFPGWIDEVRIYNKTLSNTEINASYFAGRSGKQQESLNASSLTIGDVWSVAVTPNNRTVDGATTTSNSLTILGSGLSTYGVSLTSSSGSNLSTDDLTISYSTIDTSGRNTTTVLDWRISNTSIAVLNMPFDTNVSTNSTKAVKDYSSYVNNGSLGNWSVSTNVPTWSNATSCKVGGCYYFDGVNDYMTIPDSASLSMQDSFTIMFWAKPQTDEGYNTVINKEATADHTDPWDNYAIGIDDTTQNWFLFINGSFCAMSPSAFTNNTWVHIAGVFEDSTDTTRMYIDGALVNQTTCTNRPSDSIYELRIGGAVDASSDTWFKGYVDEMLVVNKSLSAAQIAAAYQAGVSGEAMDVLASDEISTGQTWSVALTPNNGTNDGTTVYSNNLTITGQAPPSAPTSITCDGGSCNMTIDYPIDVQCSGSVDPNDETITYVIEAGDSISTSRISLHSTDVESDGMGSYTASETRDDLGTVAPWVNSTYGGSGYYHSATRSFWIDNAGDNYQGYLTSSNYTIPSEALSSHLSFWLRVNTENSYDGMWVDYSVNGGGWTQVNATMIDGTSQDYTGTCGSTCPSGTVPAWEGPVALMQVNITLPANATGKNISFRFVAEADGGAVVGGTDGYWVDDIVLSWNSTYTWTTIGNHTSGNSVEWDVTAIPTTSYETLRCKAIDLTGSGEYSGSYYQPTTLSISNGPIVYNVILNSTTGYYFSIDNLSVNYSANRSSTNITDWRINGTSIAVVNMPFDTNVSNTTSGAVRNYATSGVNGTKNGATTPVWLNWTSCKVGGCFNFTGSSYIGLGNGSAVNIQGATPLTMCAWIRPRVLTAGTWYTIATKGDWQYGLQMWGPQLAFLLYNTSAFNITYSNVSLTVNQWAHVCGRYNVTNITVYINGSLVGVNASRYIGYNNNTLDIGRNSRNNAEYFNGIIDEFLMFNRSLTNEEIRELYNAGVANRSLELMVSNELYIGDNWTVAVTPNNRTHDGATTLSNVLDVRSVGIAINFVSPTLSSNYTNQTYIAVNATVASSLSSISIVNTTIYIYNSSGLANTTYASGNTSYVNLTGLSAGTYYFNVTAYNSVGTSNTSELREITIDTTTPYINFSSYTEESGSVNRTRNYIMINVSANDTNMNNLTVRIYNNSGTLVNYTTITEYAQPGLVGYWNFDYPGDTVSDSTGVNNGVLGAGVVANKPTWNTSGRIKGAYTFDGLNDYIEIANSPSLNISGTQITLSAWVKTTALAKTTMILSKPVSSSAHPAPYFDYNIQQHYASGYTFPRIYMSTADYANPGVFTDHSATTIVASQWYHVAGVYNGTHVCTYINGSLMGSCASATGNILTNNTPVRIGTNGALTENHSGMIDDVRIYNRSLSASEILNLATEGRDNWNLFVNYTVPDNGTYYFNATIFDGAGNSNKTETRNITIETPFANGYPCTSNVQCSSGDCGLSPSGLSYCIDSSYECATSNGSGIDSGTATCYPTTGSIYSCSGEDTIAVSNNCATNTSIDSDAGNAPLVAGTTTDYGLCTNVLNTSCSTTGYADVCDSTTALTEYYGNSATYASQAYACAGFEVAATGDIENDPTDTVNCVAGTGAGCASGAFTTNAGSSGTEGCTGTCGTGTDTCNFTEYYAIDSADSCTGLDTCYAATYDADTNSNTCTSCRTVSNWLIGGEGSGFGEYDTGTSTECCGDDSGENNRTRLANTTMDNGYVSSGADAACCNAANDCVDDATCIATTTVTRDADGDGDNDYCNAGTWYDCNTNSECGTGYTCTSNECVANCNPPLTGNWDVTNTEICINRNITITNGNITIQSGDLLVLQNTSVYMNMTADWLQSINVSFGGELRTYGGSVLVPYTATRYFYVDSHSSGITNFTDFNITTSYIRFRQYGPATAYFNNSSISGIYYTYRNTTRIIANNSYFNDFRPSIEDNAYVNVSNFWEDVRLNMSISAINSNFSFNFTNTQFNAAYWTVDDANSTIRNCTISQLTVTEYTTYRSIVNNSRPAYFYFTRGTGTGGMTINNWYPPKNSWIDNLNGSSNTVGGIILQNINVSTLLYVLTYAPTNITNSTLYYYYAYAGSDNYVNNSRATYRSYFASAATSRQQNTSLDGTSYTQLYGGSIVNFTQPANYNRMNLLYVVGTGPSYLHGFVNFTGGLYAGTWTGSYYINRFFPINVTDNNSVAIPGALVFLKNAGGTTLSNGTTNSQGIAFVNATDDDNTTVYQIYLGSEWKLNITMLHPTAPHGININITQPVITSTSLLPASPVTSDTLVANITCTDSVYSPVMAYWKVYLNNSLQSGETGNITINQGTSTNVKNISSSLTSRGNKWLVEFTCGNNYTNSTSINTTERTVVNEPPPKVNLTYPGNGNDTFTNRTPRFIWQAVVDQDGDTPITYTINVSTSSSFTDSAYSKTAISTAYQDYDLPTELAMAPTGTVYYWRVQAHDGTTNGSFSDTWNFTLVSLVSVQMITDSVNFTNIEMNTSNDTSDNIPGPFVIKSFSNTYIDMTNFNVSGDLWSTQGLNTKYFQLKIRTKSDGSFNQTGSNTTYFNVTNSTYILRRLNYTSIRNNASIDVNVTVPLYEGIGTKTSTLGFYFATAS